MLRWLAGRGASPRRIERQLALITDDIWRDTINRHEFLAGLSPREDDALRHRAAWLLASKDFSGADGLEVSNDIMLSVAVQAALPILELDTTLYEGWSEIIMYPGGFIIPRSEMDERGVVHEYVTVASGEAWEGGPVILSWEDTEPMPGMRTNVVIHEFAHKIDLYAGGLDGVPALGGHRDINPAIWLKTLHESFDALCDALRRIEESIPSDVDPDSEEAETWFDSLPMDPYGATDHAEFFAVSSETFFIDPLRLSEGLPQWYALLSAYYHQDPLGRLTLTPSQA